MKISLIRPRFTEANMISGTDLFQVMLMLYSVKLWADALSLTDLTWIWIFFHGIRSDAHNKCSEIDT